MFLFKKVIHLQRHLQMLKTTGHRVGFVPTMGALHEGHLSLVTQAKSQCDRSVVSIFVNPTQFNDASDLEKYPRTLDEDIKMLCLADNDIVFAPSAQEVYPPGLDTTLELDFGSLANVLEGAFRPGHFDGMAQVVNRLLDIVQPHALFMGQKDFQQLAIVRSMLKQLHKDIDLMSCPIIRESDGLAMSSRNRRLTPEHRQQAVILSKTLQQTKSDMANYPISLLQKRGLQTFVDTGFRPDYFDIVDGYTLQPINNFSQATFVVVLTAVWVGKIRLIDNLILKASPIK